MPISVCRVALRLVTLTSLLGLVPAALWSQVSVQVWPDNGSHPDPIVRYASSTGNTVTFTVVNNGTFDTQYGRTCTALGKVTSVSCTAVGLIAAGGSKTVTATFSVGTAGTGSVRLTVTATSPTGASAVGKWDETVVNPPPRPVVTPDNSPVSNIVPGSIPPRSRSPTTQ